VHVCFGQIYYFWSENPEELSFCHKRNSIPCPIRTHLGVWLPGASEPWLLGNETEIRFSRTRLISQGINMPIMVSANNYHVLRHISIFQSRFRTNDKNNYCMDDSSKINIILIFVFFYFNISCSVLIWHNSTTVKENWVVALPTSIAVLLTFQ
jgi:hypothetical protein